MKKKLKKVKVKHGGDRKSSDRNCHLKNDDSPKNQSELANIYGIARTTMNNYMRMADMIPRHSALHLTYLHQPY